MVMRPVTLADWSPCRPQPPGHHAAPPLCPGDEDLPGGAPRPQQGRPQPTGQVPSGPYTMTTRKVLVLVERCRERGWACPHLATRACQGELDE